MKTRYIKYSLSLVLGMMMLLLYASCIKENFTQTTDETPNISTFLKNSEDYSLFYEALTRTKVSSYLDAWGTYTVFAPNNAAMQAYLQQRGKQSVADVAESDLKFMVNQHIVTDTVSTSNFRDGKITKNSVAGLFITTGVRNESGVSEIILNKEAVIILPNQRTGNGLVHGIDKVFTPITKTLMEQIQADPALSLFAEAMEATGLDVFLNTVENDKYSTVLAVTNDVFAQRGFHSLQDLKDKYSDTGNPKNASDSLYLHMAYHIVNDLKYVSDLMIQSSHTTKVRNEIVVVKVDQQRVLINEQEWLGTIELGAEINREISDNTTRNGVLHYMKDNIFIKQRSPFPVYWDPADQPEFRTSGIFRKTGGGELSVPNGFLKDVSWEGSGLVTYINGTAGQIHNDYLQMRMNTGNSHVSSITFKTPILVSGRYRVWVGWRRGASGQNIGNPMELYFNNVKLSRILDQSEYRNTTLPARELEAIGYKRYIASTSSNIHNCKMMGIIDVEVTDRHELKFVSLGNQQGWFWLDMIHFIPVDQEQIYPWFDVNGQPVWP